jgi:hypothetical protein
MNKSHKKFILKKLIPFIMRDQGRGFDMEIWIDTVEFDGATRKVPVCGTVACIGGSIQVLKPNSLSERVLGLTGEQCYDLFHNWDYFDPRRSNRGGWPNSFARRFKKAKTTLGKAKVACDLLREVVKTEGKCLDPK